MVEDDSDLRHLFATHLRLAGFRVDAVGDGLAALRMLDADPPDLIVLDLGLPLVRGEYVASETTAQAQLRQIPVVVVTGQPSARLEGIVDCVLTKPVELAELLRVVRRCLRQPAATAATGPLRRKKRR